LLARKAKQHKENPEKFRKRASDYITANREKVRARVKARYQNNPEKFAEIRKQRAPYQAAYYKSNREKLTRKMKEYREENKDALKAHRKAHPEYHRNSMNRRRALKRKCGVGNSQIIYAWERMVKSNPVCVCYWCRKVVSTKKIHFDHVLAISLGGQHSLENLCVSCPSCNHRKHAKSISDWNQELEQPVLL